MSVKKEAGARIKINKLLEKAGWRFFDSPQGPADIQLEQGVKIKPKDIEQTGEDFEKTKQGRVDYLLLDKQGFPLVVLEAKRGGKDPLNGKEQARKYAHSLNVRFVILSNGNLHYFWDLEIGNPEIITQFPHKESVEHRSRFKPNNNKKNTSLKEKEGKKNILNLSSKEAQSFFIEHKNYCNFDLPPYIQFNTILQNIHKFLKNKQLSNFRDKNPKNSEKVNHIIIHNKDGRYSWRPVQLVHPALYISLVHEITKENHWKEILKKFKDFSKTSPNLKCMSIPVIPTDKNRNPKSEQILHWWEKVEQESIKMSLSYDYLIHTDISNCYGSLYTHSIAWALHEKTEAKRDRGKNKQSIGNIIDEHLMYMSYGQTNGIPQGSVLMDFIAEMVLGDIDICLIKKIEKENIKEFNIIRYRDDYRIFTNSFREGEKIIKCLSEILIDFGMTLNPNKTKPTDQIITGSIKDDKLYWMRQITRVRSLQKHLLIIHDLSMKFPNSGSLQVALSEYYNRIRKKKKFKNTAQLISIIVDIAYHNSRTYPVSAAIISKLISHIGGENEVKKIIDQITKKFKKIPNTGHLDIWLQRAIMGFDIVSSFNEPICKLVKKEKIEPIWNSEWIKEDLKKQINNEFIIDERKLEEVKGKPIEQDEFEIFPPPNSL